MLRCKPVPHSAPKRSFRGSHPEPKNTGFSRDAPAQERAPAEPVFLGSGFGQWPPRNDLLGVSLLELSRQFRRAVMREHAVDVMAVAAVGGEVGREFGLREKPDFGRLVARPRLAAGDVA